jgi:STE24 endopeptidase
MIYCIPKLVIVILLLSTCAVVAVGQSNSNPPVTQKPTVEATQRITAYTLPPDRHRLAHQLHRTAFGFRLAGLVYLPVVLLFILYSKLAANFRSLAERITAKRIVQGFIFTPLLIAVIALFQLPIDVYFHHLSTQYGLSIQSWPSWLFDWTKEQGLNIVGATLFVGLLYVTIRRSPRRWWFYFWLAALPIGVFLVFIQPIVLDPAFNRFEPLIQRDAELATSLSKMAQRAGEDIPVDRIFWMDASEKTTTLNAYVTGIGASKRIVVWDTTIEKLTAPQIVFVASHEMGHYVLHHVVKGLVMSAVGSLLLFYLGFLLVNRLVITHGERWALKDVSDYASLPVLLLVITILLTICTPMVSGVSRYFEHQADQYALEITHSLTPDAGQVGAQAFQALGTAGLADPDPNPINVFLFSDHPPISDRVQFCLGYDQLSKE